MAKITTKTNFRVIVKPWTIGKKDSAYEERRCHQILSDIKRHVDNIGDAWVENDTETTCSLCGLAWEIDEETNEPTCCDKAIEEFNEQAATAQ